MGSLLYLAALVLGCALLVLSTYRAFVHVAANTAIGLGAHAH